jgi:hypothetical protein
VGRVAGGGWERVAVNECGGPARGRWAAGPSIDEAMARMAWSWAR